MVIGGGTVIHQFVRIGRLAMLGGYSATNLDIPPYHMLSGRGWITGLNTVGLRREETMSPAARREIKEAHRVLYRSELLFGEALDRLEARAFGAQVQHLIAFCRASERGLAPLGRPRKEDSADEDQLSPD